MASIQVTALAVCARCAGIMREKADAGVFSKTPLGRMWVYECDHCGRQKMTLTPLAKEQDIPSEFLVPGLAGIAR